MRVRRHGGVLVNVCGWRGVWLLGVAEHSWVGEKGVLREGYSGAEVKWAVVGGEREEGGVRQGAMQSG